MNARIWLVLLLVAAFAVTGVLVACDDDDDDDDNDDDNDDDFSDFPATISGTVYYDGDKLQDDSKLLFAITDHWPMSEAPTYFVWIDMPAGGFPAQYTAPIDRTGEFYPLAALDVDPDDLAGMNLDVDPLDVPEASIVIQEGDNPGIDFYLVNPEDIGGDDDDDDDNDTPADDDDDDNDTTVGTGITGTLTYAGSLTGETVVFGFWSGLPAGPPDHSAEVDLPEGGFPFDYTVETEFTGDWRVVAFLDVDPEDGPSINFGVDPNNWSLTMAPETIEEGSLTTVNITLVDPAK
jgi:hypothetical protein